VYKTAISLKVMDSTASKRYSHFEYMNCKVVMKSHTLYLAVVYRPPPSRANGLKNSVFFEEWLSYLDGHSTYSQETILVGDLNFHLDIPDNPDARHFLQGLESRGLKQHVVGPTHKQGHTLDVLITKDTSNLVSDVEVTDPCLCDANGNINTDHFAIIFQTKLAKPPHSMKTVRYRKLKSIDVSSLRKDIRRSEKLSVDDGTISQLVQNYTDGITELIERHAPMCQRTITLRPNAPWYCDSLRQAKWERRRLERRWRTHELEIHRQLYRAQCTIVNNLLIKTRQDYYQEKLITSGSDQKAIYKTANFLLGRSRSTVLPEHESSKELANRFGAFFTEKIVKIRQNLTSSDGIHTNDIPDEHDIPQLTEFAPVTEEDVRKVIAKSPNKSCDMDPLPTWLLKDCLDELLPSITRIINRSLREAEVPRNLKLAHVKPLLKKSGLDGETLNNYRPVSNLSFLSKILEKVVALRLDEHLDNNSLRDPYQSAYTQYHSTETAIMRVQSDILSALDSGAIAVLVLLDLSAAFDTLDHDILLDRFKHTFAISGSALSWIASYLTDRYQTVIIDNELSDPSRLQFGVPQGSVLGPKKYPMYTKPLGLLIQSHGLAYHMYADDTQVYVTFSKKDATDQNDAIARLENCLRDIRTWMGSNKLKLNNDKTEVMFFTPRNYDHRNPVLVTVGDSVITPTTSVKNLGVIMDRSLSMDTHITNVSRTCYMHLRNIGRIRRSLTLDACKTLVHGLVTSRLDYCNGVLYGLPAKSLSRLQRIQNTAARIITRTRRREHITPALVQLHWLPVNRRVEFKILMHTYRALHDQSPVYMKDMVHRYTPKRTLRSMDTSSLVVPRTKTITYGDRSFRSAGPKLWNSLPLELRDISKFETFKKALKTYLFRMEYLC